MVEADKRAQLPSRIRSSSPARLQLNLGVRPRRALTEPQTHVVHALARRPAAGRASRPRAGVGPRLAGGRGARRRRGAPDGSLKPTKARGVAAAPRAPTPSLRGFALTFDSNVDSQHGSS